MNMRFRPLDIRGLLDLGFVLLRERFWTIQFALLKAFLPSFILLLLIITVGAVAFITYAPMTGATLDHPELFFSNQGQLFSHMMPFITILMILLLLFVIASAISGYFFCFANIKIFQLALHHLPCTVKTSFQGSKEKIINLFLFQLLVFAFMMVTMVPYLMVYFIISMLIPMGGFVLQMAYSGIGYLFCLPPVIIVLENCGVMQAISRSFQLLKNHHWRVLAFFVLYNLFNIIITYAAIIPLAVIIFLMFQGFSFWYVVIGIVLITFFLLIFSTLIVLTWGGSATIIYYDLRTRKEGYDIQWKLANSR